MGARWFLRCCALVATLVGAALLGLGHPLGAVPFVLGVLGMSIAT